MLVWAPAVVSVGPPQFDVTTCSSGCRDKHGSTKPPNSLPRSLLWSINMAPDADKCGPKYVTPAGFIADCSVPWWLATASKATLGWMTAASPKGLKPSALWPTSGQQPNAHPRQPGVPQPSPQSFPPKLDPFLCPAGQRTCTRTQLSDRICRIH